MNYFALIGDIIDSKKIDNHYQVQKNIGDLPKRVKY